MEKTSQPTPSNESSDFKARVDQLMEGSRQALLENKRNYPPLDLAHYEATGEFRPWAPYVEPSPPKQE